MSISEHQRALLFQNVADREPGVEYGLGKQAGAELRISCELIAQQFLDRRRRGQDECSKEVSKIRERRGYLDFKVPADRYVVPGYRASPRRSFGVRGRRTAL